METTIELTEEIGRLAEMAARHHALIVLHREELDRVNREMAERRQAITQPWRRRRTPAEGTELTAQRE